MKQLAIVLVMLLPMTLSAAVTETVVPANSVSLVEAARETMKAGDYESAYLLFQVALERDPHSPEALDGRGIALALMEN